MPLVHTLVRITYGNGSQLTFDVGEVAFGVPEVEVRGPVMRATPATEYEDDGAPTSRLSRSMLSGEAAR